jgi:hypothetical protein
MKQKGMATVIIAIIVVIAIAISGIGVYLVSKGGVENQAGGGNGVLTPATTSLEFKLSLTSQFVDYTLGYHIGRYRIENIGYTNMKIRMDKLDDYSGLFPAMFPRSAIVRTDENKAYAMYENSAGWVDVSESPHWEKELISSIVSECLTRLSTWGGGEITFENKYLFSSSAVTWRVYDIQVNPSLSDSIFEPS